MEREIRRHYVQVGLGLGQGNIRLEPGKDAQGVRVALQLLQIECQRYPYIKLISCLEVRGLGHEFELPWKHAHDRVADVVQRDAPAENVGLPP